MFRIDSWNELNANKAKRRNLIARASKDWLFPTGELDNIFVDGMFESKREKR